MRNAFPKQLLVALGPIVQKRTNPRAQELRVQADNIVNSDPARSRWMYRLASLSWLRVLNDRHHEASALP
jgi:hypothetical protein